MTSSLKQKVFLLGTVVALLWPAVASAQSHLIKLELEGSATNGTSTAAGATATFTVKGGEDVGHGTAVFTATNAQFLGGNGAGSGSCSLENGSLVLTLDDPGSTITMHHLGIACSDNNLSFVTWNLTYFITGGTGRFAGATGTGNLVVGMGPGVQGSIPALLHVDGNAKVTDAGNE